MKRKLVFCAALVCLVLVSLSQSAAAQLPISDEEAANILGALRLQTLSEDYRTHYVRYRASCALQHHVSENPRTCEKLKVGSAEVNALRVQSGIEYAKSLTKLLRLAVVGYNIFPIKGDYSRREFIESLEIKNQYALAKEIQEVKRTNNLSDEMFDKENRQSEIADGNELERAIQEFAKKFASKLRHELLSKKDHVYFSEARQLLRSLLTVEFIAPTVLGLSPEEVWLVLEGEKPVSSSASKKE